MRKILIMTLASLGVLLGASPAYTDHSAPTGLSVTGKTTNSISLDWNDYSLDPSVIRQYRVRVYNSAGTLLSARFTGNKTSAYTVTGLRPTTGYGFAVAVQFSGGHVSGYSSRVSATTSSSAPSPPETDRALNKPATASSSYSDASGSFPPGLANDGNSSTRWSSTFQDNQWWRVDLGDFYAVERVELNWEDGYPSQYHIQVSDDATNFTTVVSPNITSPGSKTHTFAPTRARYVRVLGVTRATPWGISLWDASVFGAPTGAPTAPPSPPPSSEPAPIAGQGYRKVFADEFSTYDSTVWRKAHWLPAPPADAVWAENGLLNLASRRAQGFPDVTLSTRGTSYKGPDNRFFRYGYFEGRVKWTPGQGSWPAFWLLSNDAQWGVYCPPTHGEIDMFDNQGTMPNVQVRGMHSNSWGTCKSNQMFYREWNTGVDTTQAFHIYSVKWTPDRVCWYFDEAQESCRALDGAFVDVNQDMNLNIKSSCGGWTGGCTASSPNVILTQFDWVRVWQQ
jgi:beta-glucanase (GH16 family)